MQKAIINSAVTIEFSAPCELVRIFYWTTQITITAFVIQWFGNVSVPIFYNLSQNPCQINYDKAEPIHSYHLLWPTKGWWICLTTTSNAKANTMHDNWETIRMTMNELWGDLMSSNLQTADFTQVACLQSLWSAPSCTWLPTHVLRDKKRTNTWNDLARLFLSPLINEWKSLTKSKRYSTIIDVWMRTIKEENSNCELYRNILQW